MRAARLLQCLLILQNRGRQTAGQLAHELEVSTRTILRDVDAMTEAGLPIIVHRGQGGGIELGFNYRTRLTGLAADEAEALGILLSRPAIEAEALGLGQAARRAVSKLVESLPDPVRDRVETSGRMHRIEVPSAPSDPRVAAVADAMRNGRAVTLDARGRSPRRIRPGSLGHDGHDWWVGDRDDPRRIPLSDWHDINISRIAAVKAP